MTGDDFKELSERISKLEKWVRRRFNRLLVAFNLSLADLGARVDVAAGVAGEAAAGVGEAVAAAEQAQSTAEAAQATAEAASGAVSEAVAKAEAASEAAGEAKAAADGVAGVAEAAQTAAANAQATAEAVAGVAEAAQADATEAKAGVAGLESRVAANTADISSLSGQVGTLAFNVGQAAGLAGEAKDAADAAQATADEAKASAASATTAAGEAQTAASAADSKATQAQADATSAQDSAAAAQAAAESAQATATTAQAAATTAQTVADTAQAAAESAQADATTAQTTAEAAQATAESVAALSYQEGDRIEYAMINGAGYITAQGYSLRGQIPLTKPVAPGIVFQVDWHETAVKGNQNWATIDKDGDTYTKTGELLPPLESHYIGANSSSNCETRYGTGANLAFTDPTTGKKVTSSGYVRVDMIPGIKTPTLNTTAKGAASYFTLNAFGIAVSVQVAGNQATQGQEYADDVTGETRTYQPLSEYIVNNAPAGFSMYVTGTFVKA